MSVKPVNDPPEVEGLEPQDVPERSIDYAVPLAGIDAGGGESQPIRISAVSSNQFALPNPVVEYVSGATTGNLLLSPIGDENSKSTVSVQVEDGGLDGDISTEGDNKSTFISFEVNITPVNDPPTLNHINDIEVFEGAPEQTVYLTGISDGDLGEQELVVTAESTNSELLSSLSVLYVSKEADGELKLKPASNKFGQSTITVTVEDYGPDENLATKADNGFVSRSFVVSVLPVNDKPTITAIDDLSLIEDSGLYTVNLSGISAGENENQPLRVFASNDNEELLTEPNVVYTSGEATGSLMFAPKSNEFGSSTITLTLEDAGPDGDFETSFDNKRTHASFNVDVLPVNDLPTLLAPFSSVMGQIGADIDGVTELGQAGYSVAMSDDGRVLWENFQEVLAAIMTIDMAMYVLCDWAGVQNHGAKLDSLSRGHMVADNLANRF